MKHTPIRCTCPRGRYSVNCRIKRHRDLAWDINSVFATRKTTEERLTLWINRLGKGLYLIILGLGLIIIENTIRQVVTSEPSVPEIVRQQTERKTTTAPVRDPNLLPTLEEAFSKPIVTEGE